MGRGRKDADDDDAHDADGTNKCPQGSGYLLCFSVDVYSLAFSVRSGQKFRVHAADVTYLHLCIGVLGSFVLHRECGSTQRTSLCVLLWD